jgi:hypothetical protein
MVTAWDLKVDLNSKEIVVVFGGSAMVTTWDFNVFSNSEKIIVFGG